MHIRQLPKNPNKFIIVLTPTQLATLNTKLAHLLTTPAEAIESWILHHLNNHPK